MSNRPLGPWVWCHFCKHHALCLATHYSWNKRLRCHGIDTSDCHPRLTLIGHIRRILGMQIGEE